MLYNLAIPLSGIYPRKMKILVCTDKFIAASFRRTQTWKQVQSSPVGRGQSDRPHSGNWLCSAAERSRLLTTWMDLKTPVTLSEGI